MVILVCRVDPAILFITLSIRRCTHRSHFELCSCRRLSSEALPCPRLVVSFSHTDEDIDRSIDAIAAALGIYRKALNEGVEKYLVGRPVKPAIRKFV